MNPSTPSADATSALMQRLCAAAHAQAASEVRARSRKPLSDGAVMARLGEGLAALHAQLTHATGDRRRGYLNEPPLQLAYLAHHFPMHAAKVALLVSEARQRWTPPTGRLRVLDVGAGPLSAAAGAALALRAPVDIMAVDHAGGMMRAGLPVVRALAPDATVTLREGDVSVAAALVREWNPHLVVAANVVGELPEKARRAWLWNTVAAMGPDAHLLILEPGTRDHGMALLEDRELLLDGGRVHIWAPCVGTPACPLRGTRDWCHAERSVKWPAAAVALARAAGIESRQLKFSHLWVATRPPPREEGLYRLIGGAMRAHPARMLRYACGPRGRVTLGAQEERAALALEAPDRGAPWPGHPGVTEVADAGPSSPRGRPGTHPRKPRPPSGGGPRRRA